MAGEIVEPWDDNIHQTYKQENVIGKVGDLKNVVKRFSRMKPFQN